eukprot:EG_transcript_34267
MPQMRGTDAGCGEMETGNRPGGPTPTVYLMKLVLPTGHVPPALGPGCGCGYRPPFFCFLGYLSLCFAVWGVSQGACSSAIPSPSSTFEALALSKHHPPGPHPPL